MVTSQASGSDDPPTRHCWKPADARRRDVSCQACPWVDVESCLALWKPRRRDRPHSRDPAATHHTVTPSMKTVLEAEVVLTDPIGALLAGFILQIVTTPLVATVATEIGNVATSIGF